MEHTSGRIHFCWLVTQQVADKICQQYQRVQTQNSPATLLAHTPIPTREGSKSVNGPGNARISPSTAVQHPTKTYLHSQQAVLLPVQAPHGRTGSPTELLQDHHDAQILRTECTTGRTCAGMHKEAVYLRSVPARTRRAACRLCSRLAAQPRRPCVRSQLGRDKGDQE